MEPNKVAITPCVPTESDAHVMQMVEESVARLGPFPSQLANAKTIAVKINAGVHRTILTDGRQTELSDPAVVEGVVKVLRAQTDAQIVIGDAPTEGNAQALYDALGLPDRLAKYSGVTLTDFNSVPIAEATMPHQGAMFTRYIVPAPLLEADAVVSVAKMKAHQSLGCTLSIKNLFGWMPTEIYGAPRMYLHDRLIRLPRVLSDLAQWLKPSLCVVDAMVAANKSEWGGEALRPGLLLAGFNCVATDATGARVMGFDPQDDYPAHPFLYRRNTIKLASDAGLGPVSESEIVVLGPLPSEVQTPFTVHGYDPSASVAERVTRRNGEVLRGAACVRAYQAGREELTLQYGAGRFLALRLDTNTIPDPNTIPDFTVLAYAETINDLHNALQGKPEADFVVFTVPPERETEQFHWYQREAQALPDPARFG
jgi:uncharacterized protein (DUF362 family)